MAVKDGKEHPVRRTAGPQALLGLALAGGPMSAGSLHGLGAQAHEG